MNQTISALIKKRDQEMIRLKTYGLRREDRHICGVRLKRKRKCRCGDWGSKHPKFLQKDYNKNKRLKKYARRQAKIYALEGMVS